MLPKDIPLILTNGRNETIPFSRSIEEAARSKVSCESNRALNLFVKQHFVVTREPPQNEKDESVHTSAERARKRDGSNSVEGRDTRTVCTICISFYLSYLILSPPPPFSPTCTLFLPLSRARGFFYLLGRSRMYALRRVVF